MRSGDIPELFKDLLPQNYFSQIFCTGNIGNSQIFTDYIKSLGKTFNLVRGEYEDSLNQTPEYKIATIGKFKIGLVHGHQIIPWGDEEFLLNYMREHEVDIIISGHTHEMKCSKYEGKLFINPGSFTGAYGPYKLDVEPSFVVLEVKEKNLEAFFYQIVKKEVVINKMSYIKGEKFK